MLNSVPISPHRRDSLAVVLIAPAAAVVFTAMLLPLAYAIVMSLFDYRQGFETQGRFLFLQNYVRFFQDKIAIQSLFLTLTFTFFALLLELLLGVGFSVLLLTIPTRIAQALRGIYSMPLLISPIIVGLIWRYMSIQLSVWSILSQSKSAAIGFLEDCSNRDGQCSASFLLMFGKRPHLSSCARLPVWLPSPEISTRPLA